jgi:hypothetical protein
MGCKILIPQEGYIETETNEVQFSDSQKGVLKIALGSNLGALLY